MPDNILIIANKPPYPSVDGGTYAMGKFEQLMRETDSNVFYFAISTPKHPLKEDALPSNWKLNENYFTEYIDTGIKNKHVIQYFAGSSIRATRFYLKSVEDRILEIIKQKSIHTVVFESIYSAVYLKAIKKNTTVKTYVRAHNIEHRIWERFYDGMPRGLKKLAYKSETSRLTEFEDHCLQNTTGNIFISNEDQEYYTSDSKKDNSVVIPIQMNAVSPVKRSSTDPLRLFHIGAMDWLPNLEGVENFLNNIFPIIIQKYPSIHLHLAGKSMPRDFTKYKSDHVTIHGQVEDAVEFISQYDVLIVPILSGSGIRIKILEAMAEGKPVISTSAGIEGIKARPGKDYLLANDPSEWIIALEFLNQPSQYELIANNALSYIRENYSESSLLQKLKSFIKHNH